MDVSVLKVCIEVFVVTADGENTDACNLVQHALDQREQVDEKVHDLIEDLLRRVTVVRPNTLVGVDFYVLTEKDFVERKRRGGRR